MRNINDYVDFGKEASAVIASLKDTSQHVDSRWSWTEMKKDYEPSLHLIMTDYEGRKDKKRSDGTMERAARINVGLEKLLVRRMTEFMFATPVKRIFSGLEDSSLNSEITNAFEKVYKHARINSENLKRATSVFASCECLTLWYAERAANNYYGFKSDYKLRCKTFSAMEGYTIYPLFDEYEDMLAVSVEYSRAAKNVTLTFFETWTADRHIKWVSGQGHNGWEKVSDEQTALGKIPLIYIKRESPIYDGLQIIRNEIEYALSRNADIIAYNSAPLLKIAGQSAGRIENKESAHRAVIVENGGDVSYVSWSQSIEATKWQLDSLLRFFFMQAQMPDISFDNMKGLGQIGYDARQTLLTDAHLKVGDESGIFIEAFEREANVLRAFLKLMRPDWAEALDMVDVEHVITPFVQNDEKAEIDKWSAACGGKQVCSQLDAIRYLGFSDDPEATLEAIQEEERAAQSALAEGLEEGVM